MSIFITRQYINALGSRLERFTPKGNDVWAFRCPLCGDSKKHANKTRGHIYRRGNEFFYRCFNCSVSTTFGKLLHDVSPDLAKEYRFDLFVDKKGVPEKEDHVEDMIAKMKEENEKLKNLTLKGVTVPISELPETHIARQYVQSRMIPETAWKYLSFAKDFRAVALILNEERAEKLPPNEPRLVISTLNQNGMLTGVAGRALEEDAFQRYVHIKASSIYPKIFGLDRIKNFTGEIFVFEGPIDSMFFEDSLATCDSDLSFAIRYYKNAILVFDNQPRNKDIVKGIGRAIDNGFRVCIFPENNQHKDVNDMVMAGMSIFDIRQEILAHTYEGMSAKFQFNNWKKNSE